ncbi:MAG: twin-arginine translocase TatA/TatE family subunit [Candidatus Cryptobacteroides sp.]
MLTTPLFLNIGIWEVLIIALVLLLLLGGKKIPELMKGLGEGIRNFRKGIKGDDANDGDDAGKN